MEAWLRYETRKILGAAVQTAGWAVILLGGVLMLLSIGDHSADRDEHVGEGLALLMAGMLVLVAGNYVHHRDGPDGPDGADGASATDDDHPDGTSRGTPPPSRSG